MPGGNGERRFSGDPHAAILTDIATGKGGAPLLETAKDQKVPLDDLRTALLSRIQATTGGDMQQILDKLRAGTEVTIGGVVIPENY